MRPVNITPLHAFNCPQRPRNAMRRTMVCALSLCWWSCFKAPGEGSWDRDAGASTSFESLALVAGRISGLGDTDGQGAHARFWFPWGLAADGAGNLFVSDRRYPTIRKIVLATQEVTTIAGAPGICGSADGVGASAEFCDPRGMAADGLGNLYVADYSTIRRIVLASGTVRNGLHHRWYALGSWQHGRSRLRCASTGVGRTGARWARKSLHVRLHR
jgi:hypothetical protein